MCRGVWRWMDQKRLLILDRPRVCNCLLCLSTPWMSDRQMILSEIMLLIVLLSTANITSENMLFFLSRSSFIKLSFISFLAKYKGNLETTSSSFLGKIHKRETTEVRLWHDKREAMKRVNTLKSKTDLSWNRWRLASSDRPHSRRGSRWTQRMPDRLCLLVDV